MPDRQQPLCELPCSREQRLREALAEYESLRTEMKRHRTSHQRALLLDELRAVAHRIEALRAQ